MTEILGAADMPQSLAKYLLVMINPEHSTFD
jgi:hypothetical protein